MIAGNRELIGQALANLIDNALKYGAAAEGTEARVTLEAWRAGESVRLAVSDHGPGIPEAERGRVLDRFVRLEDARSRPGFGLGLSLVNAVVAPAPGDAAPLRQRTGSAGRDRLPGRDGRGEETGDIPHAPPSGGPVPVPSSRAR